MTISEAWFINFQAHEKTHLELSPWMNVFYGESDHGKSSLLRGFKWNILNRPNGYRFRRHDSTKTSVIINSNGVYVDRTRTDESNTYGMGIETYSALRGEVPEEITKNVNLSEVNFQSQSEVYFLIDLSPGQVSKKLNEVAGLEISDQVLKQANSDHKETKAERDSTNKKLVQVRSKVLELDWSVEADKFLKKLEDYQEKINNLEEQYSQLSFILGELKELLAKRRLFISDNCIADLKSIMEVNRQYQILIDNFGDIDDILENIDSYKQDLSDIRVIDLTEVESLSIEVEKLEGQYDYLNKCLTVLKDQKTKHIEVSGKEKSNREQYYERLRKLGKCPTCEQPTNNRDRNY